MPLSDERFRASVRRDPSNAATAGDVTVAQIRDLLIETARWSRVAERNGDLHARIASALADDELGRESSAAGLPVGERQGRQPAQDQRNAAPSTDVLTSSVGPERVDSRERERRSNCGVDSPASTAAIRPERDPVRALQRVLEAAREYAAVVPVREAKASVPKRERLQAAIADYDEVVRDA